MSPFAWVDVARTRAPIQSAARRDDPGSGETTLADQDSVLARMAEHHAGLLSLTGASTLAVMAAFAVVLVVQILVD